MKNNILTDIELDDMTYEELEENRDKINKWLVNYWGGE